MLVLLVGQVLEPFDEFFLLARGVQALFVAGLVVKVAPGGVDGLEEDEGAVRAQQALDGRPVPRHLGGEEEMGAGNVSSTVETKVC